MVASVISARANPFTQIEVAGQKSRLTRSDARDDVREVKVQLPDNICRRSTTFIDVVKPLEWLHLLAVK